VHRNTAVRFFHSLRVKIALKQQARIEQFCGDVELDESYFGVVRKGKRGRGSAGKVAVFGILKRGGTVYTQVIHGTKTDTLMPIIQQKIAPDSVVYTYSCRSYNALDVSEFRHFRTNHSTHFAEQKTNHINGIENVWNQAKRHLRKFNGVPKKQCNLFLKESEWRLDMGAQAEILDDLKKMLKQYY
jgi:transposase